MKILSIAIFAIAVVFCANAQNVRYSLLKSAQDYAIVKIDYFNYSTKTVVVDGESMQNLVMADAYPILERGNPELLQNSFSLIIPENSVPEIQILDEHFTEIDNFSLAPSKGMLYRNVNPESVPFVKNDSYKSAHYLLGVPAAVAQTYKLRDFNGVSVKTYPFDYNPANKTLKVYSSVTIKVSFKGGFSIIPTKNNVAFDAIYSNQFLNYASDYRSTPITEEGDMLIISPENFYDALQPYIDWKVKTGYNVELVSVSDAGGNSNAIKNYISQYYQEHNLAFVLIVGDSDQFPTPSSGGNKADNLFAEIVGNDYYPDIILGKISAETVEQVETQVERALVYEQNPPETAHFPVFCGIASQEGGYSSDNGEIDYEHIRLINNKLLNYTYTSGYEFFEGSQGGLDANGNPTSSQVSDAINAGVGIITYCGHGNWNTWASSGFSNNDVDALNNVGKLPFVYSVACVNGDYAGKTCFAEHWLRATQNGQPTGAAVFVGSTINQSWTPPMRAQDSFIDMLVDTTNTIKKLTFGGLFFNSIIKMLDVYNTSYDVARTWILFGDPTLHVRTAVPEQISVIHDSLLIVGSNNVEFISTAENAKVTLSHNQNVLNSGSINSGLLDLELTETFTPADTLFVTATAFNCLPYIGNITFFINGAPYLICSNIGVNDANANNNAQADYGETVYIAPTFKNVGMENIVNSKAYLASDDEYVTIINNLVNIGSLVSDSSVTKNNAFTISVSNDVPDKHVAILKLTMIFDGDTTYANKSITLHAPNLKIDNFVIDDSESENNNGRVDFGEEFTYKITIKNIGSAKSQTGTITISNPSGDLSIANNTLQVPAIEADDSYLCEFNMQVHDSLNEPTIATLQYTYNSGNIAISGNQNVKIGFVMEDFENANFTTFNWQNNSNRPWTISTQNPYEGMFCAKSGNITYNASSTLRITADCSHRDTISFYYKVSCETYDGMTFRIDNVKKGEWSGEIDWTRAAFVVDSGSHTYTWTYSKDWWVDGGSDCVWIDNIEFPINIIKSPDIPDSVGVVDQELIKINILPNPATDYIVVDMQNQELPNATYRLYDAAGRLLRGGKIAESYQQISISEFSEGLYFVEILAENKMVKYTKIIKK